MENMVVNNIKNMNREEFLEYITNLNIKLRCLAEDEEVYADFMSAGDLISPTNVVKNRVLDYLCLNMKKCSDDISCAAMVYYTLINLHMFSDGNGRTSRYLFDLLSGKMSDDNMGFYYHSDSGMVEDIKDNFEYLRGILDVSIVNSSIVDEILYDKLTFIPREFLEKYSWFTVGYVPDDIGINDILPSDVSDNLTDEEKESLGQLLNDTTGCCLTPAGLSMLYVCLRKGQLDRWMKLPVNNLSIEEQRSFGIEGRFVFPIFKNFDLISDWKSEDFRTIINVANEIKFERLKAIIDIFSSSELLIDKDTGVAYRDEIIDNGSLNDVHER